MGPPPLAVVLVVVLGLIKGTLDVVGGSIAVQTEKQLPRNNISPHQILRRKQIDLLTAVVAHLKEFLLLKTEATRLWLFGESIPRMFLA